MTLMPPMQVMQVLQIAFSWMLITPCFIYTQSLDKSSVLLEPRPLPPPFASPTSPLSSPLPSPLPLASPSGEGAPCSSNSDCHLGLNERCLNSLCTCSPSFSRKKSTDVCELKKALKILLKFDSVNFLPEYTLQNSPGAIKLREKLESALETVVKGNSLLNQSVVEVRVMNFAKSNFAKGSLEASRGEDGDNLLEAECIMHIGGHVASKGQRLQTVFVSEMVMAINQANSSRFSSNPELDMRVVSLESEVNPCSQELALSYCSRSAECIYEGKGDSYTCSCGSKYTDTSPNLPSYPGEVCSLRCPEDYCSNDGYCHVDLENALLYCTCNHWNVGSRCQYSGLVVFSVLGVIVFLLLLVVACAASAFCGRNSSQSSNLLEHGHRYNNLSSPHPAMSCDGLCHSHPHLLHKPSLLSSSTCGEDGHAVRPFRITIDNLNYGESPAGPPPRDYSTISSHTPHASHGGHLQDATGQGSSSNIHFAHNLTLSNPLIASPTSPTAASASAIPTPSPRQSLMENCRPEHPSSNAAIQTDSCELSQMNDQSVILLSPEVSLDKPSRGVTPRRRKEKEFSVESTTDDRPTPGHMSWC